MPHIDKAWDFSGVIYLEGNGGGQMVTKSHSNTIVQFVSMQTYHITHYTAIQIEL